MLCPTCGATVEGSFCSRCGTPLPTTPPAAAQTPPAGYPPQPVPAQPPVHPAYHHFYMPRVSSHIHTLGILWYVYAGYLVLTGLFSAAVLFGISAKGFLGGWVPNNNNIPFAPMASFMGIIAGFLLVATIIGATMAIITGFALSNRRHWGRIFALIAAVLALIKFPAGTALGIYTLWVLAPSPSGPEYDALVRQ